LDLSSALSSSSSSSWIHLLTACQTLIPCADQSLLELSNRLYEQHFASSVAQSSPKSLGSSRSVKGATHSRSSREGGGGASPHSATAPQAIEEYRVAATARSFLLSLTQDLPRVGRTSLAEHLFLTLLPLPPFPRPVHRSLADHLPHREAASHLPLLPLLSLLLLPLTFSLHGVERSPPVRSADLGLVPAALLHRPLARQRISHHPPRALCHPLQVPLLPLLPPF
jgi:hypothetical protein